MFTIKHISPTGGETLYEAGEVSFYPADAGSGPQNVVWYTVPSSKEIKSLETGYVYVTNETGATVAKYDLGNEFKQYQGFESLKAAPPADKPAHFMKPDGRIG